LGCLLRDHLGPKRIPRSQGASGAGGTRRATVSDLTIQYDPRRAPSILHDEVRSRRKPDAVLVGAIPSPGRRIIAPDGDGISPYDATAHVDDSNKTRGC